MPLTVNVGLSRKTSENFNSQGVSIHLTAELDQALLARPDDLQGAVHELYEQADYALVRQASRAAPTTLHHRAAEARSNGTTSNGHAQAPDGRGMTQAQRNAVLSLADQLGIDPVDQARCALGFDLDHASLAQASKLIDHLKSLRSGHRNGHPG